jgi:hypothetical protein
MIVPLLLTVFLAQEPAAFTISGTVVHGTTGAALNKVRVSLTPTSREGTGRSAETGSDGRFRFEGLSQGKYSLTAERLGFAPQAYNEKNLYRPYSSAIAVSKDAPAVDVTFPLIPGAVVTGYVRDLRGEPARAMAVRAYRIVGAGNAKRAQFAVNAYTDDRGYYRMPSLAAGTYLLASNAWQWRYEDINQPEPSAYPVTFFPGTRNPDGAGSIRVEAGHEERADIVIEPVPSAKIKGTVVPPANVKGSLSVGLAAKGPFGSQFDVAEQVSVLDNRFTIEDVPTGRYVLSLWEDQNKLRGLRTIDVANSEQEFVVGDSPLPQLLVEVSLHGAAVRNGGGPIKTVVGLREINGVTSLGIQIPPSGNLFLPQVPPGRYQVTVGQASQLPLSSLTVNGVAQNSDLIDIPESGAVELSIVAETEAAEVNGLAVRDNQPAPGVLVVLVPQKGWENTSEYRFDQSDSDGTFTWHSVAKGTYLMFAYEPGDPDDFLDAETVKAMLPSGVPLEVAESSVQSVRFELPKP